MGIARTITQRLATHPFATGSWLCFETRKTPRDAPHDADRVPRVRATGTSAPYKSQHNGSRSLAPAGGCDLLSGRESPPLPRIGMWSSMHTILPHSPESRRAWRFLHPGELPCLRHVLQGVTPVSLAALRATLASISLPAKRMCLMQSLWTQYRRPPIILLPHCLQAPARRSVKYSSQKESLCAMLTRS